MKKSVLVLLGAMLLITCRKEDPEVIIKKEYIPVETLNLESIFKDLGPKKEKFSFISEEGVTYLTSKGTKIIIEPHLFTYPNGDSVSGEVTFGVKEIDNE